MMAKVSFVLALVAVGFSVAAYVRSGSVDEVGVQAAAEKALAEREREFVGHWKPRVTEIWVDMTGQSMEGWEPETLEELLEPLGMLVDGMQGK